MHRFLFFITAIILIQSCQPKESKIRFAFVSDTHIGSRTASNDLIKTVADINQLSDLDFVVLTGDITEMGSDQELREAKSILDSLNKPWFIIPGNHDTKWSESGNNSFNKIFGDEKFVFEKKDYLFVGCSSGPNMRMAPGLVPREHIVWLDSITSNAAKTGQPLVFFNHYPLDEGLANWYEVIDLLKGTNIQIALCGHGHRNKIYNFEGIPGVMGRSNLTTNKDTTGYNIVTIDTDSIYFEERLPGIETKSRWHQIALDHYNSQTDTAEFHRPDYDVNQDHHQVESIWQIQDSSDIGSGTAVEGEMLVYTNTAGYIKALNVNDGSLKWAFATGGKIYSSPAISNGIVVSASTDGNIYALRLNDGEKIWSYPTSKAIVANPVIDNSLVYCGSSDGVFRALDISNGKLIWENTEIAGFVETRPLVDDKLVYFGDWSNKFYALNKVDGSISWSWTTGKSRLYAPAACYPVKADNKIFIVAPDRYTTAFNADNGEVLWRSNEHKGRETIGKSIDNELIYIKDMHDSLHAFNVSADSMELAWSVDCGFGYEISPSPISEAGNLVLVPTQWGTVYAVDKNKKAVTWIYKLSHAIINPIMVLSNNEAIISTMDGKMSRIRWNIGRGKTI